jgi:hypothetical protein
VTGPASIIIAGIGIVAVLTAIITTIGRLITKSDRAAIAGGGLALPLLIVTGFFYWTVTMEVDDPAPGNVIAGTIILVIALLPVTFAASYFTVRTLARRSRKPVR